ncbi:MAG: TerC family protein [Candidatus Edwardsbacteria bacterium]|nr:TerC family protein [Candidatus Edwardsbacteria bacterium]
MHQLLMWSIFSVMVSGMLFIDIFATSHRHHSMSTRKALLWSIVWISTALLFCLGIWYFQGRLRALEFLTGYIIEKSLSVDNLFVFIMIFASFKLGPERQPLVLKWGILGAVVMRVVLILFGVALMQAFHWVIYVFGAILLFTAYRMAFDEAQDIEIEKHLMVRLSRKLFPVSCADNKEKFFVREAGKLCATSLFVALLVVEASDLVFAVDSIPAVLGITRDPFIAITSNIFAILGLRALYFLLANIVNKFRFLNYGVALILAFVGVKMILADIFHIPIGLSLGVIILILAGSIVASLLLKPKE